MTPSEILFQEWEQKQRSLAERLGALHSGSSYRALVSSAAFFSGQSLESIRDLEKLFKCVMADYAEFSTWMDRLKAVRARNPGFVGALMGSRNAREEEMMELLEGPSIQLPLKGAVSLIDPELPRVPISPRQLWNEIWRQLQLAEQVITTLEGAQIKLNQEVAAMEALVASFREELNASLMKSRGPVPIDDDTASMGPAPSAEQSFPKEMAFASAMESWLRDHLTLWGRDPLSPTTWSDLKDARHQISVQRDRLAEECAARVLVEEILAQGDKKLDAASARWTQLFTSLVATAVRDPESPVVLPDQKSIEALRSWLEKLRTSAQTHPMKRVAKALRFWSARLQEFESGLTRAGENLDKTRRGYSDIRGLYKALLVKSQSKGLTDRAAVAEIVNQLDRAFAARVVNLDKVRRLMKNFVEILC